jgi:hypothetical protein
MPGLHVYTVMSKHNNDCLPPFIEIRAPISLFFPYLFLFRFADRYRPIFSKIILARKPAFFVPPDPRSEFFSKNSARFYFVNLFLKRCIDGFEKETRTDLTGNSLGKVEFSAPGPSLESRKRVIYFCRCFSTGNKRNKTKRSWVSFLEFLSAQIRKRKKKKFGSLSN